MMAHREQRDISLASLRMLIVADGANPCEYVPSHRCFVKLGLFQQAKLDVTLLKLCFPGSVSSCDAFLSKFQSHGLKPEVICPCATSPEAMTVAIRRYLTDLYSLFLLDVVKRYRKLKDKTRRRLKPNSFYSFFHVSQKSPSQPVFQSN